MQKLFAYTSYFTRPERPILVAEVLAKDLWRHELRHIRNELVSISA